MLWCYFVICLFGAIILSYAFLELHYFFRMCLSMVLARFFKKKINILDKITITGFCLSNDVDTFLHHMNNARYMREIDFARAEFYERSGLYKAIISSGGEVYQGATTIRYRRFIKPFSKFYLTSQIVYWDSQSIFMEHRFLSPKDNFVHCIAICRQRVINITLDDIMNKLLGPSIPTDSIVLENADWKKKKPEMPSEVAKWIESNDISSDVLRSGLNC